MNNGSGLRVVLWLSGCDHKCKGCQNPQTWDANSGIPFDEKAKEELFRELDKDYISGLTLSGGDPLHENNIEEVLNLMCNVKKIYPNKTIWIYTGYKYEDIYCYNTEIHTNYLRKEILKYCDILVDGRYVEELRDITLEWKGSSNQRVIDVQRTLKQNKIVLKGE